MADPLEGLKSELQSIVRQELDVVKKQLDELKSGQAALTTSVRQFHSSMGYVPSRESSRLQSMLGQLPETPPASGKADDLEGPDGANSRPGSYRHKNSGYFDDESSGTPDLAHNNTMILMTNMSKANASKQLEQLIEVNDGVQRRHSELRNTRKSATITKRLRMMDPATKETILDCIVAVLVSSNALVIGISADNWKGAIDGWCYLDLVFCILFLLELVVKVWMHGFRGQFCGKDRWTNCFDLMLVILDAVQLFMVFAIHGVYMEMYNSGVPSASLFRILRLLRITRVLRLLRHPSFESLLQMIEGIVLGGTTLAWASVVFGIMIYIIALLCRDLLGNEEQYSEIYPYFKSVPRSMLTIFRCSFGDCSTAFGTPIPEYVNEHYGWLFSLFYIFFFFLVTIGLFNVISAIFVNTTIALTEENNAKKLQERFADQKLWATRVCTIIRRCLVLRGDCDESLNEKGALLYPSMLEEDLPSTVVHDACQSDEETIDALTDLDIDPHDHIKLADILDPDHSGSIGFEELVSGLHRLRGQPRRSDIVTVDLMLRSAQAKLNDIHSAVEENTQSCFEMKQAMMLIAKGRRQAAL